ncbi:MAG: type II toxin-antitoxin system RelE/ParE family toxin [Thermoanaerobaculia bacterium]
MAYRILWSDSALERATEFFDFIAKENPTAAQRVVQDLFYRVEALAEHPFLGRRLSEETDPSLRRLVIGNYIVVYRVNEARQVISISAVRHFRQRPLPQEEP